MVQSHFHRSKFTLTRVGKVDSTGTYAYVCDGTSPGSPVLSDGHALYTPGLSENRGGTSAYYSFDRLGNLWTLDGSSKNQLTYEDNSSFGIIVSGSRGGGPFGFGGANGCQTDGDTGLVLMGHRYYDTRIGRFISQDPAGDGDNWYAYADNSPTNEVDPVGLMGMAPSINIEGSSPIGSPGYSGIGDPAASAANNFESRFVVTHTWMEWYNFDGFSQSSDGLYHFEYSDSGMELPGSDNWSFAQSIVTPQGVAAAAEDEATLGTLGTPKNPFPTYDQARNAALKWLEKRPFQAVKQNMSKLPRGSESQPNGMTSANGKVGFRVEYDSNGAHINVFNGKEPNPPHFFFQGTEALVKQIIKRFL